MAYEPKGRCGDDFTVGETFENEEFAKTSPFGGRAAHGILTLAIASGHQNQLGIFEGTTLARRRT